MTDPLAPLKKRSHDQLVRAVVEACNRLPGVRLMRVDVGRGGGRRAHGDAGVPDIIGHKLRVVDLPEKLRIDKIAVAVGFEVKVGRDKLRPLQREYLDRLAADGGIAAEIRSVMEAVNLLTLGVTGT